MLFLSWNSTMLIRNPLHSVPMSNNGHKHNPNDGINQLRVALLYLNQFFFSSVYCKE